MATSYLVGGISSAGRALPDPAFKVARAAGPHIWDDKGRRYIDTALGFGGTMLGHAHPDVVEACSRALRDGPLPAFAHHAEEAAAAALATRCGSLDRVTFTNSGSEAVHLACRIARTVTGRSHIAKIAAGYDGWYDDQVFGTAGSPAAVPGSNARPEKDRMVLLRYNDEADTEALFADRQDIAAVIVEPMLANAGCIKARAGYLEHLQATARRHGTLVIADEVLMGFRLAARLTSHVMGLDPDLATVGKAIGSGIAVAAVLGRAQIMAALEDGRAGRAGTYSGNPVACAAVLATLPQLDRQDYAALMVRGEALRDGITAAFQAAGTAVVTSGFGTVFTVWPSVTPPLDYAAALRAADPVFSSNLHESMRERGVLVMPPVFGRLYLSFAHGVVETQAMAASFAAAAQTMASVSAG